ncbi:hypothetical protein [Cohnella sp. REN36]|uniref:hypothetical protein n=1 Tax=Cohnella sp. REN36 TaxID=2887347 RepID=UPI001D14DC70|nr:hypothetical protein [Cohnella sp. REN36]MCC3371616.1 hypothetical protein [Cohnella sp. REN36]
MTIFQTVLAGAVSVFLSVLISASLIASFLFDDPGYLFIVAAYGFVGTVVYGAPVSALLFYSIRSKRAWAAILRLLLHLAAGFAPYGIWPDEVGLFLGLCGMVHAFFYYVSFVVLRRLLPT